MKSYCYEPEGSRTQPSINRCIPVGGRAPRRRATSFAVAALAAVAAAVPLSLAAPATPASAAAALHRSDYLRFPGPTSYLRVKNRSIYLAAGCYTWRAFDKIWSSDRPADDEQRICLRPGRYRWHIRLYEHSEAPCMACPLKREYMLESRLYELATGGPPAVLKHVVRKGSDGAYDWGSTLQHR